MFGNSRPTRYSLDTTIRKRADDKKRITRCIKKLYLVQKRANNRRAPRVPKYLSMPENRYLPRGGRTNKSRTTKIYEKNLK